MCVMPDSTATQRTPESLTSGFYIVSSMLPDGPKPPPQRKTTPGGRLLRGRGIATDVCRHSFADPPAAGTTCAGTANATPSAPGSNGRVCLGTRCKQSGAFQHCGAVNRRLRSPFSRGKGETLLPKPDRGTILEIHSLGVENVGFKVVCLLGVLATCAML